jgi:glycosyltransferase involved in cell wall biosynthesis
MAVSGELAEPFIVRSDRRAARAPGVYTLCNSLFSSERLLAAYGIRAHLCYLGVDTEVFCPPDPATQQEPRNGNARVVAVGRLGPTKRHQLVIEALAQLPAATRPRFVVCGEPQGSAFEAEMERLAAQLSVELDVHRAANDAELVQVYRGAAATICASELEPFGLTALESIACGTPVVAVREGGFRESVQDSLTGVLVEPSVQGIAKGVSAVLEQRDRFRPDLLHASIEAGGWTWAASVKRLHRHFASALDERRRHGATLAAEGRGGDERQRPCS